jgi:hypothetical protein
MNMACAEFSSKLLSLVLWPWSLGTYFCVLLFLFIDVDIDPQSLMLALNIFRYVGVVIFNILVFVMVLLLLFLFCRCICCCDRKEEKTDGKKTTAVGRVICIFSWCFFAATLAILFDPIDLEAMEQRRERLEQLSIAQSALLGAILFLCVCRCCCCSSKNNDDEKEPLLA